jgi:hypothetical protein
VLGACTVTHSFNRAGRRWHIHALGGRTTDSLVGNLPGEGAVCTFMLVTFACVAYCLSSSRLWVGF